MGKRKLKSDQKINRLTIIARTEMQYKDKIFALDLVGKFNKYGTLTSNQWRWVRIFLRKHRKNSNKNTEIHYVYAICCNDRVKIGYSQNPTKRLKMLQCASPEQLTLRWKKELPGLQQAKAMERNLHKKFKKYHVRGEWFNSNVLNLLKSMF